MITLILGRRPDTLSTPVGEGPAKPKVGDACNGCGLCCTSCLCPIALMVLELPTDIYVPGPCPFLEWKDGRSWCGAALVEPAIMALLGTGTCDSGPQPRPWPLKTREDIWAGKTARDFVAQRAQHIAEGKPI